MQKTRWCSTYYTTANIGPLAPTVLVPWQAICGLEFAFILLGYVLLVSVPWHWIRLRLNVKGWLNLSKSCPHLGPDHSFTSLRLAPHTNMGESVTMSKGKYLIYPVPHMPCCSVLHTCHLLCWPYATAELVALVKEQALELVKEMRKNAKKLWSVAESNQESDGDDNSNDNSNDDSNNNSNDDSDEDSDEDSGPYAWIGRWIQKPSSEHCQKSKGKCKGFTTARLLKRAGITKRQYSMYKVCLQFTFGCTTDSPQKTAHRLISHYFNITKRFRANLDNHPDLWALIIEKVCPVSNLFIYFVFFRSFFCLCHHNFADCELYSESCK